MELYDIFLAGDKHGKNVTDTLSVNSGSVPYENVELYHYVAHKCNDKV